MNKKNNIEILGLIQSTIDSKNSIRRYNSDNGISIDKDGNPINTKQSKMFPNKEPDQITNIYDVRKRKNRLFDIISKLEFHDESIGKDVGVNLYNPDISSELYKSNRYDRSSVKDFMSRMDNILNGNGALYSFDLETIGEHRLLNPEAPKINKDNFKITEAAIWKTTFEDGVQKREKVYSMIGAPDNFKLANVLKSKDANQSTKVMLERLAGYSPEGAFDKNGNLIKWFDNINILEPENIRKGVENLKKSSGNYYDSFQEFVNTLKSITGENDILSTANGTNFDIPIVLAEAKTMGIDTKGLFENGEYDIQRLQRQFLNDTIYEKAQSLRKAGIDVDDSIAQENLNKIILQEKEDVRNAVAKYFGSSDQLAHTGSFDSFMTMEQTIDTYNNIKKQIGDYNEKSMSLIDVSNDTIFLSKSNFVSSESSLHYSIKNGEANTYNQVILNRNKAYKMKVSQIKTIDEINELYKKHGEGSINSSFYDEKTMKSLGGKYMVELQNQFDQDEKVVMFYNNEKEIQKDLIDSGILEPSKANSQQAEIIKKSTKNDVVDKVDRTIRNFGSASSYKKVDTLEMYINQYKEVSNYVLPDESRKLNKDEIYKLLNGEDLIFDSKNNIIKITPEDVLQSISIQEKSGDEFISKIPAERRLMFKQLYADLEANSDLYEKIIASGNIESTNSYISGKHVKNKSMSDELEKQLAKNKIEDLSVTFGSTIEELEYLVLDSYSDKDKLEYIIKNDKRSNKMYKRELIKYKKSAILNQKKGSKIKNLKDSIEKITIPQKDELQILNNIFEKRYGKLFDVNGEIEGKILRGSKPVEGLHIATAIDVLSPNGEYSLLTFGSNRKNNFQNSLERKINILKHPSRDKNANKQIRLNYANDIAKDLYNRQLITNEQYDKVTGSNSVRAKVSFISDYLYTNKGEADKIIEKVSNKRGYNSAEEAIASGYKGYKDLFNQDIVSKDEFDKTIPFVKNRIINDKYIRQRNEVMGIPLKEAIDNLKQAEIISENQINNIIKSSASKNMPNFTMIGKTYSFNDSEIRNTLQPLYNELGWGKSHIEKFENILNSKSMNNQINMENGSGKYDLFKFFVKEDESYKMILSTNKGFIKNQISKGTPTAELASKAVVINLPKIENINGFKFISQSEKAKKSISYRIKATGLEGYNSVKYTMVDTVDEMFDSFDNGVKYIAEMISQNDYQRANQRARFMWKNINESKSMTGITNVFKKDKNGNTIIDSAYSLNRADISKSKLVNHSAIVYELDNLYKTSSEIENRFDEMFGEEGKYIINKLSENKNKFLNNKISSIKEMTDLPNGLSTKLNLFIKNNIEQIAKELVSDEEFMRQRGTEISQWLEEMSRIGHVAVTGKELDVVRGYSSSINISNLVPFSDISSTFRNTQIQSLNAHVLFKDSLEASTEFLPKKFKTENKIYKASSLYKALGIKPGSGVMTPLVHEQSKLMDKRGEMFGLTAKVKHINDKEFQEKINNVIHKDEEINKVIKYIFDNSKSKIPVNKKELIDILERISESSSMYEDSGMINVLLAKTLTPRSISHKDVYYPNKDLKLGQTIKKGSILGKTIDGKDIIHESDSAIIRNITDKKITTQTNGFFDSIKINFGGSEKAIVTAPNVQGLDDRLVMAMSHVQDYIMDSASIALNPSVSSHMATNTVVIPSINAIGIGIKNKQEARVINEIFKEHAPNLDLNFVFDRKRNGYIALNAPKITPYSDINPYREIINTIDVIKNDSRISNSIKENLNDLEYKKIGYQDIYIAQDNTHEHSMNSEGLGKGTSISNRSIAYNGIYRELDDEIISQYNESYFKNIIEEDINTVLNANENKSRQVANIYSAYSKAYNDGLDYARYKTVNVKDIIAPTGAIEADMIDEIFKYNVNGARYNFYEVNLGDIGLEVDNPFYIDPHSAKSKNEIKRASSKWNTKTTNKLYIASIMPNKAGDDIYLSRTQRAQADIIRDLQSLVNKKDDNRSINDINKSIKDNVKRLYSAYEYDLTDKNGLRLKSQSTKENIGSFRAKGQKVVSGVTDDNGLLIDTVHGKKITYIDKNGKLKYRKAAFFNKSSFENAGVDFKLLGEDITRMQVSDEAEQFDFIKKYIKENLKNVTIDDNINSLEEIQKVASSNISNYEDFGTKFIEQIGVEGAMSRDPNIRIESYNGVQFYISKGIQPGATAIDPISAQGAKLDTDGDESNNILKSFYKDDNGKLRIKDYNDTNRKELRTADINKTSDSNLERLKQMNIDRIEKEKSGKIMNNVFSLKEYAPALEGENKIMNSYDSNFFTNKEARLTMNTANISKEIIGQTSNPSLYLGRAAAEYAYDVSKVDPNLAKSIKKSVALGSLIVEQTSIDYKLSGFADGESKKLMSKMLSATEIGKTWDDLFVAVQKNESVHENVVSVLKMLKPYSTNKVTSLSMIFENEDLFNTDEGLNKIAQKIIKGDVSRNSKINTTYVEEYIKNILDTFSNEKSARAYKSLLNRQSLGSLESVGVNTFSVIDRAENILKMQDEDFDSYVFKMSKSQMSGAFLADTITVGNNDLVDGDILSIAKSSQKMDAGLYKVKLNGYKDKSHSISLISENGENVVFNGPDVFKINTDLQKYGATYIDINNKELINEEVEKIYNHYLGKTNDDLLSNLDSFTKVKDVYNDTLSKIKKDKNTPLSIKESAVISTIIDNGKYNLDNLQDLHETLKGLDKYGLDNKSVINDMNNAIKEKGSKNYAQRKKEVLLKQEALISKGISNANYDDFLNEKVYNIIEDFSEIKSKIDNNKRVNFDMLKNNNELDEIISSYIDISKNENNLTIDLENHLKQSSKSFAISQYTQIDEEAFEKLQSIFTKYQNNSKFRKEVLGWDFDKIEKMTKHGEDINLIKELNETKIIYTKEHAGKKLGNLSIEQLREVLNSTDKTGISDDIIKENNTIISKLIDLRMKSNIILDDEITPITENVKDNIAKHLQESMNEELKKKGRLPKTDKSTASSIGNILDKAKTKISGMSKGQKITSASIAAISAGALLLTGSNIKNKKALVDTKKEDESNIKNTQQITVPPTENKIYTSDNNSISVNVRARSPLHSFANTAEKAISGLFGQNVSISTNIQDSRESVNDFELDGIMEKSIQ